MGGRTRKGVLTALPTLTPTPTPTLTPTRPLAPTLILSLASPDSLTRTEPAQALVAESSWWCR